MEIKKNNNYTILSNNDNNKRKKNMRDNYGKNTKELSKSQSITITVTYYLQDS